MIVDINNIPDYRNCVYKITSPSGKIYIGSTKLLRRRLNHGKTYRGNLKFIL